MVAKRTKEILWPGNKWDADCFVLLYLYGKIPSLSTSGFVFFRTDGQTVSKYPVNNNPNKFTINKIVEMIKKPLKSIC